MAKRSMVTSFSDTEESSDQEGDPKSGYNAIVNILIPKIFASFFSHERFDEQLRTELQPAVMARMAQITKVLSERDREAKIVPIVLECIRDADSEERRLQAVILIDELCEVLGQDICRDQLLYEIITL